MLHQTDEHENLRTKQHHTGMVLIAGLKVLKGLLLLIVGLGLLKLVHADIATLFSHLLEALHLNADSRILHSLVLKVDALQPHSLFMMSLVSMVKRRSEEHTSELQSLAYLVCRLLLEKKKRNQLHTRVSIP